VREALQDEAEVGLDLAPGALVVALDQDWRAEHQGLALREGLDVALDLYRGSFLDGLYITGSHEFEEWLEGERRRFRSLAEEAARALLEVAQAAGDRRQALRWAERCVNIAPTDEAAAYRLVEALARSGDRVGALEVHRRFCFRLREEFDLEPSHAFLSLREAVAAPGNGLAPA